MHMCDEQYLCWGDGDSFIENSVFLSAALLAKGQKAAACDETQPLRWHFHSQHQTWAGSAALSTIKKKGNKDR